ncbi:hypothetical protein [Nocardia sp. CA-290969]|uniref:hypothetical protein n=1 Tax=Nocardia sp. CA-290969 TaxID=3239986 RepID=UPI003D940A5B
MKHLWEYDHPYYCNEGNYLHSPAQHSNVVVHDTFPSWQAFKDEPGGFYDADPERNLLWRWDWKAWHLEHPEDYTAGEECHVLMLFFMLQRKALSRSLYVDVTGADEPEIRAWLAERAQSIRDLWAPLNLGEVAS